MESTQEGDVRLYDSEMILYGGLLSVISKEILIFKPFAWWYYQIFKNCWEFTQLSQLLVSYKILVYLQKKFILLSKLYKLLNYLVQLSRLLILPDLMPFCFSLQDTTLHVTHLYSPVCSSVLWLWHF